MDSRGSAKVQGDVHFSDPTTQAPGCPVRAQSQEGHVAHALPRPKLPRVRPVLAVQSQVGLCLLHFPGPSCSDSRLYLKAQSQLSHVSLALPRPKQSRLPSSMSGYSSRWVLCLLHFQGQSSSSFWVFYECPVPVEPCTSCSSQAKVAWCSA